MTVIRKCVGLLRLGIDYVFISNNLGTQTNIGTALDEMALPLLASEDEECLQQVYKVICHYYLPPCGNITHHPLLPSSLCQEECSHVQSTCPTLWQAATAALSDFFSFINCSSTSQLLFPLSNCCTGAGIRLNGGKITQKLGIYLVYKINSTEISPSSDSFIKFCIDCDCISLWLSNICSHFLSSSWIFCV